MDETSSSNVDLLLQEADFRATNDLRVAIYNYEFKTINNLQLINGAGASILISFLTYAKINYTFTLKILFLLAILLFLIGLLFSLLLSLTSPSFLEARYRKNESTPKNNEYEKHERKRRCYLSVTIVSFFIAILFAVVGWLLSTGI